LGALVLAPFAAKTSAAQSDSERLEKLEKAVELLQQRNAELEREVSSLKKQKSSAATLSQDKRSKFVPDTKSYVEKSETTEEKKPVYVVPGASEIKLVLGGFIQAHYEVGDISAFEGRFVQASGAGKDRFRLRRVRLNVTGDFAEQFEFKLEGEFSQNDANATRTSFGATDIFANWHRFPEFNVKVGQYKAPFGLEQITSDTKLPIIERSQVTSALTPERQIGVQAWGKPFATVFPEQKDLLTYYAGVFNGNGRNVVANDNNEYMYVGRLEIQALKAKIFNQETTLKLGGDALWSRDAVGTNLSPAGNLRTNNDGSLSPFVPLSAGEREAYGIDGSLHWGPFDLVAEYLREDLRPRGGGPPALSFPAFRADGYYVSAGYFLVPEKLQLVGKWESFNPSDFESGGDFVRDENLSSITAGLNYYIHGDQIKLMANYIHTWLDFDGSPAVNRNIRRDEFDEVILRLQVMF
jgi:phosphate-selective porin OprO/OprP